MMAIRPCELIDRAFYPLYEDRWDDLLFRKEIEPFLDSTQYLLDLGAGSGNNPYMNFKGKVAKVVGVDPDPSVMQNPFIDDARIGKGEAIPYDDALFDIVIAANTLEHLDHPESVFREISRVLKPGGVFAAKTPNKYHYVTLISRLTPIWFHRIYNSLRGVKEQDVFPTRYKANVPRRLYHLADLSGFEVISINLIEGRPEYLRPFWPLYLCGLLFERLVNRCEPLKIFRVVIIAKFRKPWETSYCKQKLKDGNNFTL